MEKWVGSKIAGDYLGKDPDWLTQCAKAKNPPWSRGTTIQIQIKRTR